MNRSITLEQSEAIVAACKSEAEAVGQPMNIAVVDSGGNLVAFAAMDDTKLIGEDIAQKKALTAVYFQMDTRDLAPLVQPGQPLYGIESSHARPLITFGGGQPLSVNGEIVGAVGVAGGTVAQDDEVASAAVASLD